MALVPHDPEEFDRDLAPAFTLEQVNPPSRSRSRLVRVLQVVSSFILGQGALQATGVITGLFLARTLSLEGYAQFGLATGFQSVFAILMDLGFASTIVPLVGDRRDDPELIGRYVRSAKHLRDRGFWILSPVAAAAFLFLMHKHHWSLTVQVVLLVSTLISLYSGGKVSYFAAPLFVFGRIRDFYLPQVLSAVARLLAYFGLAFAGALNAPAAALGAALNVTVNATCIQRASRRFFRWPAAESPATDRELLDYILPASPAIIFAAFQSQISLFLISFFGGSRYMAEVTALGRIGQLFAVLMTFNTIAVEPYVARASRHRLLRIFLGITALTSLGCVPIVLLGFLWPQGILWILGPKFAGIRDSLGWYVLANCLNLVSGVLWIMNRARKWVFWSGSILEVVLLLAVQIAYLILFGVKTTHQAVLFSLASSACYLITHGYVTIYGFHKDARFHQPSAPEVTT